MIYASPAVLLSPAYASLSWRPLILGESYVNFSGITADAEDADYPVTNLVNPQTWSKWKSDSTDPQYVELSVDGDAMTDGIGIVGHNFGSGRIGVTIEGITADDGASWEVIGELSPGDDSPILAQVEPNHYAGIRLYLEPDAVPPEAAVIYAGPTLRVIEGVPPGHVPLPQAREIDMLSGLSEAGDFVGDVITSRRLASSVEFRGLNWEWYIARLQPILDARKPFFFSWSPGRTGAVCTFTKIAGNPKPTISQVTGETDISISLIGLDR